MGWEVGGVEVGVGGRGSEGWGGEGGWVEEGVGG